MSRSRQINLFDPRAFRKQTADHIEKRVAQYRGKKRNAPAWNKGNHCPRGPRFVFSKEMDDRLIDLYVNQHKSIRAIAPLFSCSTPTITERLRALGVEVRTSATYSRGRVWPDEAREKFGANRRGKKLKPHTAETKRKMAEAHIRSMAKGYRARGHHHSTKMDVDLFFRSSYEKKYMEMLDADPNVLWYEYEPTSVTIEYQTENGTRLYKPDFLVHFVNGTKKVVEVKSEWTAKYENTQEKLGALKTFCKDNGIEGELYIGGGRQMTKVVQRIKL